MIEYFDIAGPRGSGKSTKAQGLALDFITTGDRVLYVVEYMMMVQYLPVALLAHDRTPELRIVSMGAALAGQRFDVIIADIDRPLSTLERDWFDAVAVVRLPPGGGAVYSTVTVP